MDEALKNLFENNVLSDDVKNDLNEAWNKKLDEAKKEARKEVEQELREEFSQRFETDKNNLVEAVEKMVSDNLRQEIEEFHQDRKALAEQRVKLSKTIKEARKSYNKKLVEHMSKVQNFVKESTRNELQEFNQDRKKLKEEKMRNAKKLNEDRELYKNQAAKRVNKIESFIMEQLSKEISDFHNDKKALEETRVKMVTEGKKKIDDTRKQFVKRASSLVENKVNHVLRKELSQLHEDIKTSRENDFGRRVFEAFADEYMASPISEGSKLKSLSTQLQERENKLKEAEDQIQKQNKLLENTNKKLKTIKESSERNKKLQELLGPLSKSKRATMENLLEGVKTENLQSSFHRYLPTVLNESDKSNVKQNITESKTNKNTTTKKAITGDRVQNKLNESDNNVNTSNDIDSLKHLAGISK